MRKILLIVTFTLMFMLTSCFWRKDLTISINPGVDTVTVGSTWVDTGCETNGDECILFDGNVDTSFVGDYEIYYYASKRKDELYAKRLVKVVDDIKPVVTLVAGVDSIRTNDSWVDAGCNVSDNYDENPTCFAYSSNIDESHIGTYEVVYRAIDKYNNESFITRYVTVVE